MMWPVRFNLGFALLSLILAAACSPALATRAAELSAPVPTPHSSDVADLLRHPSAPGVDVEVDAYYSGATYISVPGGFISPRCPSRWNAALTDRPLLAQLQVLNGISSNGLPDDAPWLIAAIVKAKTPEPGLPDLPYHARLRGHLGDTAFTSCKNAERIFVVEKIVQTFTLKAPGPQFPFSQLPADYEAWLRYHDAALGYSVRYPPDWQIEQADAATLQLHAPQWHDYPVKIQVRTGETHFDDYDPASAPPLLKSAAGWGVFQQSATFAGALQTQQLAGYTVSGQPSTAEREETALFSGGGRTYELSLRYPVGFDAPQPLLTAFTIIVQGFRLDVTPGPTPTPPVRQTLGQGPFISRDEATARARTHMQQDFTLLDARLVPEVQVRRPDLACSGTIEGHFDGIWELTVKYTREETSFTALWFLDATNGKWLCGEEMSANATAVPITLVPGAATPAPPPTPFGGFGATDTPMPTYTPVR